jgi:kynureninase
LLAQAAGYAQAVSDLTAYRAEFPILEDRTYLISASLGPLSIRSRHLAEEHLQLWQTLGPEELWFDHGMPRLQQCRELLASLIGASAAEIAVVPSVSSGLSSLATCFDFDERPKVVLTEMDFPTNHYVWRAQQRRGAKLDVVPSPDGVRVPAADVVERIDEQTRIVNLNRVLFESSWIMELEPIIATAHDAGAYVVADDFHGTGVLPLDVHELGIDFLLTGALKWLCGGQGIAFLYCRADLIAEMEPLVVGWFGTKGFFDFDRSGLRLRDDARRFETGTPTLPQAWTAAGGMEIITEVGVEDIRARSMQATALTIDLAYEAGLKVLSPREAHQRGGLVRVQVPGGPDTAKRVLHDLFANDVVLDRRGDALRISPHFFNTDEELELCFRELKTALAT